MKKLLFAFMAVGLLATASSCKKCGYCATNSVYGNSEAVCNSTTPDPFGDGDNYREAQANCQAQGGRWVVTK